jgi:hypothetical protein
MNPEQVRELIQNRELTLPYSIITGGGKSYPVTDHANVFITPAYPDTLIIAVPHQGIACVGLGAIDAIHLENEAAASRGQAALASR